MEIYAVNPRQNSPIEVFAISLEKIMSGSNNRVVGLQVIEEYKAFEQIGLVKHFYHDLISSFERWIKDDGLQILPVDSGIYQFKTMYLEQAKEIYGNQEAIDQLKAKIEDLNPDNPLDNLALSVFAKSLLVVAEVQDKQDLVTKLAEVGQNRSGYMAEVLQEYRPPVTILDEPMAKRVSKRIPEATVIQF